MPYISLPDGYPGIRSLFMYSPLTAQPLNLLVQRLLHDKDSSTLTPSERELIATYTSSLSKCKYCTATHGAIAKYQLNGNDKLVKDVIENVALVEISSKLRALLGIAFIVQQDARKVTIEDIEFAKENGATEKEIHDTVLITAAFCMFNRYVDGLAAWATDDEAIYDLIGKQRAAEGYLTKPFLIK